MKIKVPYNYLILSAFRSLIKYDNRRYINLKDLENYLEATLNEVIGEYEDDSVHFKALIDKWQGKVELIKDQDYLPKFLTKYQSFFALKNNWLEAASLLDYEDIYQLMCKEIKEEKISNRFLYPLESLLFLQKLGIKNIFQEIRLFLKIEEETEKLYINGVIDEVKYAESSLFRVLFLNNLSRMPYYKIDGYLSITSQIMELEEDQFDFFPIDYENLLNSPYYAQYLFSDSRDEMLNYLNKAIFGHFPLFYEKTLCMFEDVIDNKNMVSITEMEAENDILEATALLSNDELKFCFFFLKKLNEFIDQYGDIPDLINCKRRILYVIDNPNIELTDEELVSEYIDYYEELSFDDETSFIYKIEAYLMVEEIFTKMTTANIKKIIFIATYYEITHDPKIVAIIDKHYQDRHYHDICELIFGDIKRSKLKLEEDPETC